MLEDYNKDFFLWKPPYFKRVDSQLLFTVDAIIAVSVQGDMVCDQPHKASQEKKLQKLWNAFSYFLQGLFWKLVKLFLWTWVHCIIAENLFPISSGF